MIDPVCGRDVGAGDVRASVVFRGRRWFFCDDVALACRLAFKREPERWAAARPDAGAVVGPIVPPRSRAPSPFRVVAGEVDSAPVNPNHPEVPAGATSAAAGEDAAAVAGGPRARRRPDDEEAS